MQKELLRIISIKKEYNSESGIKQALKGVSFSVHQGETLALLGVNGAGKTTLSSIIATLHPATSGTIYFQGKSIYNDIITYRKKIGFCPQKINLNASLTLQENLLFSAYYYGLSQAQASIQVKKIIERFELKEYVNNYIYELSGGYRQRFLIARSLIHSPELLILDEPTVALDPHIRHQLWDIIRELKAQGVTILITTHYLDEAESLADRVCILDHGLIQLIDTPQALKENFKKENLEQVFLQLLEEN